MTLPIARIESISREVAEEYSPALKVVGVASAGGDSSRVELLVTIDGRQDEPCIAMVNVTRAGRAALERDLREKFDRALNADSRD